MSGVNGELCPEGTRGTGGEIQRGWRGIPEDGGTGGEFQRGLGGCGVRRMEGLEGDP